MLKGKLDTPEEKIRGVIILAVTFFIAFTVTTWFQIAFAEEKSPAAEPTKIEEIELEEPPEVEGDFKPEENELPAICFEVSREYFCYREG